MDKQMFKLRARVSLQSFITFLCAIGICKYPINSLDVLDFSNQSFYNPVDDESGEMVMGNKYSKSKLKYPNSYNTKGDQHEKITSCNNDIHHTGPFTKPVGL